MTDAEFSTNVRILTENLEKFHQFLVDHEMYLCRELSHPGAYPRTDLAFNWLHFARREFEKAIQQKPYDPPMAP